MKKNISLELSNGLHLRGTHIGSPIKTSGELVFTTAMVGYSEALSDPSYFGQVLVFAYPLIGNYGVPKAPDRKKFDLNLTEQFESQKIYLSALIISQECEEAFHWTSAGNLDSWLKSHNIPGISGVDTRHLITEIRNHKQLFAKIIPDAATEVKYIESMNTFEAGQFFDPNQYEVTKEVSIKERKVLGKGKFRVAVYDYGVKWNILRQIIKKGCEVELLPWDTDPGSVDCHGWILSNGPGNPHFNKKPIEHIQKIISEQEKPLLAICLGHQLLSIAGGAKVEKMQYGHRSHNQPVKVVGEKRGFITSQNHSYVVKAEDLPEDWEVWFSNINDNTVEGIRHKAKPFRSVQFHPESSGGPRDTSWIINDFVKEVKDSASISS